LTIAVCSVLNFVVSDRLVFQPSLWETGTVETNESVD